MKCKSCGAGLDLTMSKCPACGAAIELGRLTGILGVVCRACDAYNEPGAKACAGCGKPLGGAPPPVAPPSTPPSGGSVAAAAAAPPARPEPPPSPGAPVIRSFPKPSSGAATRFVPSVPRSSSGTAPPAPPAAPAIPALTPIPLVASCPRCGADAGAGRFCSNCGQALGARGTQLMMKPPAAGAPEPRAPLAPGRAKLVLDAGGGAGVATLPLDAERVDAGRAGAVAFPDDPHLAPHHATFFYEGDALHVRDEGAPGGIYLRLRGLSVPLRAGDHFAIGERLLRYAGALPQPPPGPPDGTRRLGAPRPAPPAIVVEEWLEGGTSGRVFVRSGPSVTIGRAGCAVNLGEDRHLSQAHAEIIVDPEGDVRLRDLGSSNGTYVKVPPHGQRELRDGDCIRMGREVLRVVVAEK